MNTRDPEPFTVIVTLREAIRINSVVSLAVNESEFRGWPPRSIALMGGTDAVDADGNVRFTLRPIECTADLKVLDPDKMTVGTFQIRESADFGFLEELPGYQPVAART